MYVGRHLCSFCHLATYLAFYQKLRQLVASLAQLFSLASFPHNMQSQSLRITVNQAVCHLLTLMWQEKEVVTIKYQDQAEVTGIPLPVWTSQGDPWT